MDLDSIQMLSRKFIQLNNREFSRDFPYEHSQKRLIVLLGQRGVGKTTLLIQALLRQAGMDEQSPKILYVSVDHFLLQEYSLYDIAEQFHQQGGELVVFDEIHKYTKNWSMELKSIYDTFPELKVWVSGSCALKIYQGTHDLSRRALIIKIQGLSFREYLALRYRVELPAFSLQQLIVEHEKQASEIVIKLEKLSQKVLPLFKQYLQYGYYPYCLEMSPEDYLMTVEQDIHATIESDLMAIYPKINGVSLKKIKQLFSFIAEAVPFTPNWQKIKTLLDIGDVRTLKTYFKYLEEGGLINALQSASKKIQKIENPEKIFLNNASQLYALSPGRTNLGTLRETFFVTMLKKQSTVDVAVEGDFLLDNHYTVEVGGKNKGAAQIKNVANAFMAIDDIELGIRNKIPLWLFGFLY